MQKRVTKSNRKIGKRYRSAKKLKRIRKPHRKRLKAVMRR